MDALTTPRTPAGVAGPIAEEPEPGGRPRGPWQGADPFAFAGVALIDIDLPAAVTAVAAAAREGRAYGLHLCNAYTLTLAARSPAYLRTLHHDRAVNLPDGTPVTWFYRLLRRRAARGPVRGPSLMKGVLAQPGLRHFLLGGTEPVLEDLQRVIAVDYPGAVVVGSLAPPYRDPTDEDLDDYAAAVRAAGAQVVWVGLGTPRQDDLIARLTGRVDAVLVGVGAAFDFISGNKPEAPAYLHQTGLEWTYRLANEPGRLWRRYLVGNALFLLHGARQLARGHDEVRLSEVVASDERPVRVDEVDRVGEVLGRPVTRVRVGEALVHCVSQDDAVEALVAAARRHDRPWLAVTPNIQHVALLEVDPDLRAAYARADLVLADGWPVVAAVRLIAGVRQQRVTGADLLPALCACAAAAGLRVGLLGGLGGVASAASERLRASHPGLQVVCVVEPPLGFEADPAQVEELVAAVRAARVDVLFLALGAPKQEKFALAHLEAMDAGVTVCVGAAVDFVAGHQRRAPHLARRVGMEWAFRALHEPRRLLPRYARSAPVFARAVLRRGERSDGPRP